SDVCSSDLSNIGSEFLLGDQADAKTKVDNLVKQSFKPEFLNRIDEIITFNALGFKVQVSIARKMLNELSERLLKQNIHITFDDEVQKYVIKNGYDEKYGARPLKRFIQRHLETYIAQAIINEQIEPHLEYQVSIKDEQFVTERKIS